MPYVDIVAPGIIRPPLPRGTPRGRAARERLHNLLAPATGKHLALARCTRNGCGGNECGVREQRHKDKAYPMPLPVPLLGAVLAGESGPVSVGLAVGTDPG